MTSINEFRAQFPVLAHTEYLNAGTEGPVPEVAAEAAAERLDYILWTGRSGGPHWEGLERIRELLRSAYAGLLGCASEEVALCYSTGDALSVVLQGLELQAGDEVLTTDEEHFGLLAPLGLVREERGITIRTVPFDDLAGAIAPQTKLVACSHVSYVTGKVMDIPSLTGRGPLVLIDGAQAFGAIDFDVRALGCDFYAAPGQKWVCGPDGTGSLYICPGQIDLLRPRRAHYFSLAEADRAPDLCFRDGARRFDLGVPQGMVQMWALAALDLLDKAGWSWVLERGPAMAQLLVDLLGDAGIPVAPRGPSTLVSFHDPAAAQRVYELCCAGYAVRDIPGRSLVRVSAGAWTSEEAIHGFVEKLVSLRRAELKTG